MAVKLTIIVKTSNMHHDPCSCWHGHYHGLTGGVDSGECRILCCELVKGWSLREKVIKELRGISDETTHLREKTQCLVDNTI